MCARRSRLPGQQLHPLAWNTRALDAANALTDNRVRCHHASLQDLPDDSYGVGIREAIADITEAIARRDSATDARQSAS